MPTPKPLCLCREISVKDDPSGSMGLIYCCQVMVNTEKNLQKRKSKTGWWERGDLGGPLTKTGEKTGENFPLWEGRAI